MNQVLFSLTEGQIKLVREFEKRHDCKYRTPTKPDEIYVGAIGGATTYRFTPTSLEVVSVVMCSCGKEMDLTDYESW